MHLLIMDFYYIRLRLGLMIFKVFSNLSDSMILYCSLCKQIVYIFIYSDNKFFLLMYFTSNTSKNILNIMNCLFFKTQLYFPPCVFNPFRNLIVNCSTSRAALRHLMGETTMLLFMEQFMTV